MLSNKRIFVSTLALVQPEEWEALMANEVGIEIFAEGPEWREPKVGIKLMKELLRDHNGPRSLHAPFFDLNPASDYPAIRELTLAVLKRSLELAPELECEYVVIHPDSYSSHIFNRIETQKRAKDALYFLAAEASKAGVKLAIENVGYGPTQLFDSHEFTNLAYEIENIAALLDVGHAYLNGWDIPQVIGQLEEKLVALHLHDNRGQADEHLPLGDGKINYQPIWEALTSIPSTPALVLEYYKVPLNRVLSDVQYLKQSFKNNPLVRSGKDNVLKLA